MSKHHNEHQIFQQENHTYHCKHKSKHKKHHHHGHHKHSLSESDYFRTNSLSHKNLIGKIFTNESRVKNCDRKNNGQNQDYYFYTNNFKKQKQIDELQKEINSLNKRLTKCETVLMKSHYEYQLLRDTVQKMKIQNIERGVYDYQLRRQRSQKVKQKQHQLLQQKYGELMNFNKNSRYLQENQYQKKLNFNQKIKIENSQNQNYRQTNYDRQQTSNISNEYYDQDKNQQKNLNFKYKNKDQPLQRNKTNINAPRKYQNIKRKSFLNGQIETSYKNSEIKQNKQSKQTTAHTSALKNNIKQQKIASSFAEKQHVQNAMKLSTGSSKLSQKDKLSAGKCERSSNQSRLKQSNQGSIRSSELKKQTPYKLLKLQQQKKQQQVNEIDQYFDIQTFKQIDQTLNDNQKDSNLLQSVQFIKTNKNIKVFQPFPSFKKQNSSAIQKKSNNSATSQQKSKKFQENSSLQTVQSQYSQLQKVMQSLYQKLNDCSNQIQKQKLSQKIIKVEKIIEQIKFKYNF